MRPALVVCCIAITAAPAFARTYVYTLDFVHAGYYNQDVTISYVSTSLTAPGTDLTSLVGGGLPPSSYSNRDNSGAWNFYFWNSPTATASFSAGTDLSFPNVPGFYSSLPATFSVQQMFGVRSGSTTVNISIQDIGISSSAYNVINSRTLQNQTQFFVYKDMDSGFNHGFPSGLFGSSPAAMGKLHFDPGCLYDSNAANGCSTDSTVMDMSRGTVFRLTFDPLSSGDFVGLNFEEPENWGATHAGVGYDLTGATQLTFDIISPTGGISVQFSINGVTTPYVSIPQQWTSLTINLGSLGLTGNLSEVHLLFGIGSNDFYGRDGGTVLLDNIQFQPVPLAQTTTLGFPLANQVSGIIHVQNALPGSIPIPPDEINSNLTTIYESSLAVLTLLSRGSSQDLTSAKLIADTLVYALGHDNQGDPLPTGPDGSAGLHNGMFAGDLAFFNTQGGSEGQQGQIRLSGFTAPALCPLTGFCLVLDGATGGNNAFAMMALLAAYRQFQNTAYLNAAITIGNWIYGNLLDSSATGFGGYVVGYPDQGLPKNLQPGKSTENNADIFAAFMTLANLEAGLGNTTAANSWTSRANIAGDFVIQMFDSPTGHFFAGTVPLTQGAAPGVNPNGAGKGNDVINTFDFLDAQTFPALALAGSLRYRNAIDWRLPVQWVLNHFAGSVTANSITFQGFDLIEASEHQSGDGPAGIAWEFTAQSVVTMQLVAALYNTSQFDAAIGTYLNQIRQAQTSAPFGDGLGLVAGTMQSGGSLPPYQQCYVTPYQCIGERVGLAATSWAIAADQSLNVFTNAPLPSLAVMSSPTQGSTLTSSSVTFQWSAGASASAYWLDVGTIQGQGNIFASQLASSAVSQTVNGIPANGGTIYVRLWTQIGGVWQYHDYSYTAASMTLASMSSPTPGSTLSGPTVTFSWAAGVGASAYWLDVGTVQGQGTIFAQNVGLVTSQMVNGISTAGGTIYVRLWTQLSGNWQYHDYMYTAASSGITTPAPDSVLPSPSATFNWTAVAGADQYWLDVGSAVAIGDYYGGPTTGTSASVNNLPCDARTVYVQLWAHISGNWQTPVRYTYTATGGCAALTSPASNAALSGTSATFTWNAIGGADQYWLDLGNSIGVGDIFAGSTTSTSVAVNSIPCDGRFLYAQLWTHSNGAWHSPGRYDFTAWGACGRLTVPSPGATLSGSTVTFNWNAGMGVTAYWLDVGTVLGQGNIFGANLGTVLSRTVSGIPTDGSMIYVQLWSQIGGVWYLNRYSYTAF